jgi:hypothetical protein
MTGSTRTPWTETMFSPEDVAGVSRDDFANALQIWSVMQNRFEQVTVNEAALAFNTSPEIIRRAVADHYWMDLQGDIIVHEGE